MKNKKNSLKVMLTIVAVAAASSFASTTNSTHAMKNFDFGNLNKINIGQMFNGLQRNVGGLIRNIKDDDYRHRLIRRFFVFFEDKFKINDDIRSKVVEIEPNEFSFNSLACRNVTFAGIIEQFVDDILTLIRFKDKALEFISNWCLDKKLSPFSLIADCNEIERFHSKCESFISKIIEFAVTKTNLPARLKNRVEYAFESNNDDNKRGGVGFKTVHDDEKRGGVGFKTVNDDDKKSGVGFKTVNDDEKRFSKWAEAVRNARSADSVEYGEDNEGSNNDNNSINDNNDNNNINYNNDNNNINYNNINDITFGHNDNNINYNSINYNNDNNNNSINYNNDNNNNNINDKIYTNGGSMFNNIDENSINNITFSHNYNNNINDNNKLDDANIKNMYSSEINKNVNIDNSNYITLGQTDDISNSCLQLNDRFNKLFLNDDLNQAPNNNVLNVEQASKCAERFKTFLAKSTDRNYSDLYGYLTSTLLSEEKMDALLVQSILDFAKVNNISSVEVFFGLCDRDENSLKDLYDLIIGSIAYNLDLKNKGEKYKNQKPDDILKECVEIFKLHLIKSIDNPNSPYALMRDFELECIKKGLKDDAVEMLYQNNIEEFLKKYKITNANEFKRLLESPYGEKQNELVANIMTGLKANLF